MTIKNGRIHSIRHGSLRHEALGLNKELKSMEKNFMDRGLGTSVHVGEGK